MKSFELVIATDSDAFGDNPREEIARILRAIARRVEDCDEGTCVVKDIDGNTAGEFYITE